MQLCIVAPDVENTDFTWFKFTYTFLKYPSVFVSSVANKNLLPAITSVSINSASCLYGDFVSVFSPTFAKNVEGNCPGSINFEGSYV